jgi:phage tail-like protein
VIIKLPALWFDDLKTTSELGVYVVNQYPEDAAVAVGVSQDVVFEIISTAPGGVDLANTDIEVGGSLVMSAGVFQAGFLGSSATPINVHDYRIVVVHDAAWLSEQLVSVHVVSQDVTAGYVVDTTYSFTVEDITEPRLLSATATAGNKIRVAFNEAMLRSSTSGTNDAMNPSLYSFEFIQQNDREAGVRVVASSVVEISPTVFDVTTDIVLTFGKTYKLTGGDIADASLNILDADYRTAQFIAWTPPAWPGKRRFSIWYDLLAEKDRTGDTYGDLERMCSIWQDALDVKLWEIDSFDDLWDVDSMPESFCDALLADLGNPFGFDMTSIQKRKLIDLLIPSYAQRGTDDAIINMARFFLGITVTVTAYNGHGQVWVLEDVSVTDVFGYDGGLGVDSIIGPSAGTPELYTFEVYSGVVLTADQRRALRLIIEEVKCAHEHYVIHDPSDAVVYDPWEIGISRLGFDTYLHD